MKLKTKISLYTAAVFILLLVLINGAIYVSFRHMLFKHELTRSEAEALKAALGLNDAPTALATADLLRAYMPVNGMLKIVMPDGRPDLTVTDPAQPHLIDLPTSYQKHETRQVMIHGDLPHSFVSLPIITKAGTVANLQLTESLIGVAAILQTLKIILLTITAAAALPVLLSTQLLSDFISRPIVSMIQTMADIRRSGRYKRIDLPLKSKDELAQLGHTFNSMMDQLQANYESQELFVANASHELKTPLTIISSYSDLLRRRGLQRPELFEEAVEAIRAETLKMEELIQQLLFQAKNRGQWDVTTETLDLKVLVAGVIASFGAAFGRQVDLHVQQAASVLADEQMLKQILYILLENACKYSQAPVLVSIGQDEGWGLVQAIDTGIGIAEGDLSRVFDRFYRVDKARARETGGFGLGLPLAREMAEAMNGRLELLSTEGEGTTAQIFLPLAVSN